MDSKNLSIAFETAGNENDVSVFSICLMESQQRKETQKADITDRNLLHTIVCKYIYILLGNKTRDVNIEESKQAVHVS